jgi:hypothetical protein
MTATSVCAWENLKAVVAIVLARRHGAPTELRLQRLSRRLPLKPMLRFIRSFPFLRGFIL